MHTIIFFLMGIFAHQEIPNNLVNTKWKFVGYITPVNDTIRFNSEINYTMEFLTKKKLCAKASLQSDRWHSEGKYKVNGDKIMIQIFIPKGTSSNVDEKLAFEEFNLRLRYNQSLNGKNIIKIHERHLILKRDGVHTMLFKQV